MASRILLADDSITIQKVVNLTFADEGIEVVAVSNGDMAERRLAEVQPDLVLADIFMPGKNGYELCEAIKENSQFRNVPVVLLVGAFEPFDQTEARRVGADAHLTKPFESRTLVETVRRLISASPRTAAGPIAPAAAPDDEPAEAQSHAPAAAASPFAASLAGRLDLSAMMDDLQVAPAAPPVRNTGELASPAPDAPQEALDLGFADAPASESTAPTLTDTSERFESLEFSPNSLSSADAAPPFGLDAPMARDLDTSTPVEPAATEDPISCGTDPELETEKGGPANDDQWFSGSGFETTRLDMPAGDGAWQPAATGAPLGYQSPDFRLETDATFGASEAQRETACATLLAVDEPLGDVLFDEAVSGQPLTLSEAAPGDSFGLEFLETQVAKTQPEPSTQFDLVETVADSTPNALAGFDENAAAPEMLTTEEAPTADDGSESPAASSPQEQPTSPDVAGGLDWTTPLAAGYSTAQLDSVVMPIGADEHVTEDAVEVLPQPESREDSNVASTAAMWTENQTSQPETPEEDSFTAPAMWTEEETPTSEEGAGFTAAMWTGDEARFTPIDIEAVAVESASEEEVGAAETGFAFAPAPPEEPPASIETPVATGGNGFSHEIPATELSSAAIEEIVRRVVAEMSESVVREVALEVVPGCGERVID